MKLTDWIQAVAAVLAAIAAWGAWLSARHAQKKIQSLRSEIGDVTLKLNQIENHVSVHHSPVFNMGDHVSSPSIVAGTSVSAGGDIIAGNVKEDEDVT